MTAELQPTGRFLATGGTDSIIALWDTNDWIVRRTLSKMSGPVRSISEWHPLLSARLLAGIRAPQGVGPQAVGQHAVVGIGAPLLTDILGFTFDGSYIAGGSDEGMLATSYAAYHQNGKSNFLTEAGVHVWHTETGEHMYTFKSAGPSPVVAWAPTRYCLAFSDNSVGALRIAGVDPDRK